MYKIYLVAVGFMFGCSQVPVKNEQAQLLNKNTNTLLPLTLSQNEEDKWTLISELSDEFDNSVLDSNKWFIQGKNNEYHLWKGSAPAQFNGSNTYLNNGKLVIETKWEPQFDFSQEKFNGRSYENVTTGGIVSKNKFLYGYMEIKSKAAFSTVSSSFGGRNKNSEFELFEQVGDPKFYKKRSDKHYNMSIYSLENSSDLNKKKIFNYPLEATDSISKFHVYGCEWDENGIKYFVDGQLIFEADYDDLGNKDLLTEPIELWANAETVPYFGLPSESDLPSFYEIDYIRVWQKKEL
ncbi:family 16 glycosylhydrolase [Flammeovirga sp. MY04]|uniref:family 16 glycosylhydrolase n=1 Tax=Flammeovirga sp. MY04 TaxID=1191459 RepID=UPI0008062DD1|nr:family 16 glycosylhydrolase [Flammeovirga sp. MY04]ANQ52378.1 family 16 glycosylhydrolase [Flammeovirga sp. MY04]